MVVVLIVLIVTNLVTLGALAYLYVQPIDLPGPDPAAAAALDRSPTPSALVGTGTRRMISIEILNPIELAGTQGRLAGIAGLLVPKLTRRIVYDQALKTVKQMLVEQHVVADVRLHTLRPVRPARPEKQQPRPPVAYADQVQKVDLDKVDPETPPADPPEEPTTS